MQLNLSGKKIAILGIQGSGKTVFAQNLAKDFKAIVYTPHIEEWKSIKANVAQFNDFLNDFEKFCMAIKRSKYKLIVIDEFDMLFSKGAMIKFHANDLFINHRHYDKIVAVLSRRPQDIPTKIFESCHYIAAFSLEGFNAIKRLNEIREGFGEMVSNLEYGSFKFVLKEIGKEPVICEAVKLK